MAEPFPYGSMEPAAGAFAIAPNDGSDLSARVRAITIGTDAGTLSFVGWDGVTYTTGPLPVGTHPVYAKRVRVTGTTATGLTGWI